MDGIVTVSNGLTVKNPENVEIFVSKSEVTIAYLYCADNVFYAMTPAGNSESFTSSCNWRIYTYLTPSPVICIFSLLSLDCCFCQNGALYRIPLCTNDILRAEAHTSKEDVFMDIPLNTSQMQECASFMQIARIQECDKIFADEHCKHVHSFGNFICLLLEGRSHWELKIHKFVVSTFGSYDFQQMTFLHLPCCKRMKNHPVMTAFRPEKSMENDTIEDVLLSDILKTEVASLTKWTILVTVGDGTIYSISFNEEKSCEPNILPLFCLHQPVVAIRKLLTGIGTTRRQEGLLCIGSLGKVILVFQASDYSEAVSVLETHIPGPVKSWSSSFGLAFHTDGLCLWRTVFQPCQKNSLVSAPHLETNKMNFANVVAVEMYRNVNNEEFSNLFLYTEDGTVLLLQKLNVANMVLEVPKSSLSDFKSMTLKTLLNKIHECSEHLSQVNNAHENRRKLLKELACASHLLLNEKVKKTLNVSVTSQWDCSEPNIVSVCVKLHNSGNFVIMGNHWHFVVSITTATGSHLTTSTSVIDGLQPGKLISIVKKVHFGNIITGDKFPVIVACSLQFFIDIIDRNAENLLSDTLPNFHRGQAPVTFHVNLWNSTVDELHFLHPSVCQSLPCFETSMDASLLELARSRPAAGLHGIESIMQPVDKLFKSSFTTSIKIHSNYAINILKGQTSFQNSPIPVQLLEYITKPSDISLNCDSENTITEVSLFGQKVTIQVSEIGLNLKVRITVSSPYLLPKLKGAVLRRLKLLNDIIDSTSSERNLVEGFPVLQSTVIKSLALKSLINQSVILQPENYTYLINEIYKEMREHVSAELPFI